MGFFKRIFSIRSKKDKKPVQRPQIVPDKDARLRAIEEEEHEAAVGRLLRSSSARYTVVSEVEYSSLPPLPHPINEVLQASNSNAIRLPGTSTTSIASSTISQRGTYNVTVHKRKQHNPAEFHAVQPAGDVMSSERSSDPMPKEISSHLLELRSHPSVISLLDMYDEQGRIPDQAFSSSPPSPEYKERPQTRRNGSTLRELLGEPPSMSSRKGDKTGSAEGDISWAERFLGEGDSVSSTASSINLLTPSIHNTHSNNHDLSLTIDHDLSIKSYENSIISSMEVEVSIADSLFSNEIGSSTSPYNNSDPTTPQRASQVFQFLTERKRPTYEERSLLEPPSAFSGSSEEGSHSLGSDDRSHFSNDSFDATNDLYSATPTVRSRDISNSPSNRVIPRTHALAAPVSQTVTDNNVVTALSTNATKTVWVAPDVQRMDNFVNAPARVIITAPTPSGKSETPSRIPRGPRGQYKKKPSTGNNTKGRRASTLAERARNSAVPRYSTKAHDPFVPSTSKGHNRKTPSSTSRPGKIEIGPPTRLSRRGSAAHIVHAEHDKENGNELTVKSALPSTPIRSKSDPKSLFRGIGTPSMFNPPGPSDLSSDLSPVGKELMMNVRQKRSRVGR